VEAYLDIARIVALAKERASRAVHPGLRFLCSGESAFARASEKAGIHLPLARAESSRVAWRQNCRSQTGRIRRTCLFCQEAEIRQSAAGGRKRSRRGWAYPIIVKAAMGGGGRGMRVVHDARSLMLF